MYFINSLWESILLKQLAAVFDVVNAIFQYGIVLISLNDKIIRYIF